MSEYTQFNQVLFLDKMSSNPVFSGTMEKIPFKTLRHAITIPAVRLVIFLSTITPRFLSHFNAVVTGWILSVLPLPSNKVIRKHQQTIMADNGIHVSIAKIYTSVLIGFIDFFYLSYRNDKCFGKMVKVNGSANMEEALSHGRGIIAVTAHFGAWELLPRAMKILGYDIGVVSRSMSQKGVERVLDNLRKKPGIETIDRKAGAAPILRLLRKNKTMGMLIDQDTKGVQSEFVVFLGCPARTPVAPALFAKKLMAPVVTMHISRQNNSTYLLEIDEPLFFDSEDGTADILNALNRRISQWILDAPEQWVWFHKRWRSRPD